jgi:hypothetical protein
LWYALTTLLSHQVSHRGVCAQVSPLQAILGPIYSRNKYSGHGHGGGVNPVFI